VCCFTAFQIPFIERRVFPKELAGPGYEQDIPIYPESELPELIQRFEVDFVFLAYSDLSHGEVMHRACRVQAAGASFALLGPRHTELRSHLPVVAVTAVRTGAGKSPVSRAIARDLAKQGLRVGILRHPMPYGDLRKQAVQRFATFEDLDRHECTIEEREEYAPYVEQGLTVYAGVDYAAILEQAEAESDVILWDGGNNDRSFLRADLHIVVADALRPGHEASYYPGETNLRRAHLVVITKVGAAPSTAVEEIGRNVEQWAPGADIIHADLDLAVDSPERIGGRRVLVVEDGPTLTHGGMASGAGLVAAERFGAGEVIDPRPHAVGTVAEAYTRFPHLGPVLPALGYSQDQRAELARTIEHARPDVVVDASPAGLERLVALAVPFCRVRYELAPVRGPDLGQKVRQAVCG
jgi:predicted GTPase